MAATQRQLQTLLGLNVTKQSRNSLDEEQQIAEIRKLNAEAAYAEAGVTDYRHDATIKAAEADKLLAEAEAARYEADIQRINRDRVIRQESFDLLADYYHHVHYFNGDVTAKSVDACMKTLEAWHRQDPLCDMEIKIRSLGGSVIDGMALVDQLTQYSLRGGGTHKITITVRGVAASMAAIILQTADVRRMGPEAYLLVHEPSGVAEGSTGDLKDVMKWFDLMSDRISRLFVNRSNGAVSLEEFQTLWQRKDVWLDSSEALNYGFVDSIG